MSALGHSVCIRAPWRPRADSVARMAAGNTQFKPSTPRSLVPKGQLYQSPGRDKASSASLVAALGSPTTRYEPSPNGTARIAGAWLECQSVRRHGQSLIAVDDHDRTMHTLASFFGIENHQFIGLWLVRPMTSGKSDTALDGHVNEEPMPQSLSQIYVHLVFSTKNRKPWLCDDKVRDRLHAYMAKVLRDNVDSPALVINSIEDHVHVLIRLSRRFAETRRAIRMGLEPSRWDSL